MIIKKHNGFTLIELLVVIAIIGVLSTMTVSSLNSARAKARDAKRLSDIRQMANLVAIEATQGVAPVALFGCVADIAEQNPRDCTDGLAAYASFADPSVADPDAAGSICAAASVDTCQYSLAIGSTNVQNALILFYLESDIAGLGAGLHSINNEGMITAIPPP